MNIFHREKRTPRSFYPLEQFEPVLRSSICTGEMTVCFRDREAGGRCIEWAEHKRAAHKFSSNHKPELEKDRLCGCFYCLRIYSPSEIKEWLVEETAIDWRGTAIYPFCDVDSVIGESSGYPITREFMEEMHQVWFE